MRSRRVLGWLCLAVMIAATAACTPAGDASGTGSQGTASAVESAAYELTLPYSAKDVLNPYTAKTKQNQELAHLLFDPLVKASDTFEPVYYLAKRITQNGKTLTVELNTAAFTDGSPLTASDVLYSIRQAQAEGSCYRSKLSNIASAGIGENGQIVLQLAHDDPSYAVNLDFPIIKADTADLRNGNFLPIPPVGCGRYTLQTENNTASLQANPRYYRGTVERQSISLVNCPDNDSLQHYLSIEAVNLIYSDLSDGVIPKLAGASTKTPSSSLVYLGVNGQAGPMTSPQLRQAVSFALDRRQICESAFFGYAEPATSLFHPRWSALGGLSSMDPDANEQLAVAYLEELGYNTLDEDGYRVRADGKGLTLRLLYNSENTARAAMANQAVIQLKRCGIRVEPEGVSFEEYGRRLQNGSFDLYLGEVRLANSMDVYPLFHTPGVVYGLPEESSAAAAFAAYYSGETDLLGAVSAFVSEMPFLPLCYRNGVIVSAGGVAPSLPYSTSDLYNGIEQLP